MKIIYNYTIKTNPYPAIGDNIKLETWYRFYIVEHISKCTRGRSNRCPRCIDREPTQITFEGFPNKGYCAYRKWVYEQ